MQLKLREGDLFIRQKDMRLWQVYKRVEGKGLRVYNPLKKSQRAFVDFGENVMSLPIAQEYGGTPQRIDT